MENPAKNEEKRKKSMPRRKARIAVMQAMFAHQLNPRADMEMLIETVLDVEKLSRSAKKFFYELLDSALNRESLADDIIAQVAQNWNINRISSVDRNILRMAIAEFIDFPAISCEITMDEVIEIAKVYGSEKSPKFINGILDAAMTKLIEMGILKKDRPCE